MKVRMVVKQQIHGYEEVKPEEGDPEEEEEEEAEPEEGAG